MKIRVYYEDTDTGGIVYHSNYLNFCERARSQAFFDKGLTPVLDDGHFVAKKIIADYLKSAKLGDILDVKTELIEMKAASFTLKQTVYKEAEKLFELEILLAHISFEGAIKKMDKETKELILSLF
ncbi:YbgC/FadM family acyl-CoA thioesterase [Sulfurimonas sp. C5]|uniref:YbgC/FadM family acyl-CoA thioesterase n=1 Tax=Sulfurimonas sp. C5 TaxID=3036947 RepID=UPI0024563EA8|nr:YbgC/FadM family acyl-CoA thioesterase [Sulfurimonas sp. C5]MDH4943774.1 YbgC/FadM family acyl-CoA thioesterase [Sulfurimonas sp. C5]